MNPWKASKNTRPAKKATKAKKAAKKVEHPSYDVMIVTAIKDLDECGGSSSDAILKHVLANNKIADAAKAQVGCKLAIQKMLAAKKLVPVKVSFKLATEEAKLKKNEIMSSYVTWEESENTRRYQHAVDHIGQEALRLVADTLNPRYIEDTQKMNLKDFSPKEILKIEEGNSAKWGVTLMYKVNQRVCGLAPVKSDRWTKKRENEDTLENPMYEMKELRNTFGHESHYHIMDGLQLVGSLNDLEMLSMKILNALIKVATVKGIVLEKERAENFKKYVNDVIMDVQKY